MKLAHIFRWSFLKWFMPVFFTAVGTIYAALTYHFPHEETAKEPRQPTAQTENYKALDRKDKHSNPPSQIAQAGNGVGNNSTIVDSVTNPPKNEDKKLQQEQQPVSPKPAPKIFIGKKITVSIGGKPPEANPNEIVGESINVHVPDNEVGKYDRIVGEEVNMTVGDQKEKK